MELIHQVGLQHNSYGAYIHRYKYRSTYRELFLMRNFTRATDNKDYPIYSFIPLNGRNIRVDGFRNNKSRLITNLSALRRRRPFLFGFLLP